MHILVGHISSYTREDWVHKHHSQPVLLTPLDKVVNDDGPPSPQSPYVQSLVKALQNSHHTVSVVLPHAQCSYISKAHLVRQSITPTTHRLVGAVKGTPDQEWILIDSTPASCVQIGLYHYFQERGPVDLVISGPNYGRNTTAVFVMGSGTVGGALEAALCGKKAISLSYGYLDPVAGHDEETVDAASALSVRLIEKLAREWVEDVHLFNINVPLIRDVALAKIMFTNVYQNKWTEGSCFEATQVSRKEVVMDMIEEDIQPVAKNVFHFAPVPEADDAPGKGVSGHDEWVVKKGMISVTPLQANIMHVQGMKGEITLL